MHGKHSRLLRTRVYVDGYNLYYGCLKGTPYKWLDLLKLFEKSIIPSVLFKPDEVPAVFKLERQAIKYFTAKIIESAARATDSVGCQARYHNALNKLYGDRVELIQGYYSLHKMKVKVVDAAMPGKQYRDCQEIQAWKLEEKQTDVNLALHVYHDAITGSVDQVIIVTNDTDIAPAVEMIRANTGVVIGLVIPTCNQQRNPNADLTRHAHWVKTHITPCELRVSQLPRVIPGRRPTVKPDSWYPEEMQQALKSVITIRGSRSEAFKWLETPSSFFDNQAPIHLFETQTGSQKVLAYIAEWTDKNTGQDQPESAISPEL